MKNKKFDFIIKTLKTHTLHNGVEDTYGVCIYFTKKDISDEKISLDEVMSTRYDHTAVVNIYDILALSDEEISDLKCNVVLTFKSKNTRDFNIFFCHKMYRFYKEYSSPYRNEYFGNKLNSKINKLSQYILVTDFIFQQKINFLSVKIKNIKFDFLKFKNYIEKNGHRLGQFRTLYFDMFYFRQILFSSVNFLQILQYYIVEEYKIIKMYQRINNKNKPLYIKLNINKRIRCYVDDNITRW